MWFLSPNERFKKSNPCDRSKHSTTFIIQYVHQTELLNTDDSLVYPMSEKAIN